MRVITALLVATIAILSTTQALSQVVLRTRTGESVLYLDSSKCMLRFNDTLSTQQIAGIVGTIGRLNVQDSTRMPRSHEYLFGLKQANGVEQFVDSVTDCPGIEQAEPVYKTVNGFRIVLHQIIVVAFQASVSRTTIDSVNSSLGTIIDHEIPGMPNVFILKKVGQPHRRMIDVSNSYSSLPSVRYAAPDPGCPLRPQGYVLYDYYAQQNWQIRQVIGRFNTSTVWDFSRLSQNVLVAVIDDGVEPHEDLDSVRSDLGYDFADFDSVATPGIFAHGMALAGIIGAKHTNNPNLQGVKSTGTISLNPHARIIPLKVFTDDGWSIYPSELPQVFTWAASHGAAVINFSYSFGNPDFDNPALDEALQQIYTTGRGGKGIPIICSSGDYAGTGDYRWLGRVDYPASLPQCLAVGSVDVGGQRYPWSMYGDNLGVVAPSGDTIFAGDFFSLDRMGSNGFNPTLTYYWGQHISWDCRALKDPSNNPNYDCKFGGTSASAAIVSGIANLLISKNPNLTAAQIYDIIKNSAVPLAIPEETGHGRADAFRAILSVSHGDVNNDGIVSLSDMSALTSFLTGGGFTPYPSTLLGDWNCSGEVDLSDLSACVSYLQGRPGAHSPVVPCFAF